MSKSWPMSNRYYRGNAWYRFFKTVIFTPLVKTLWRPEVIGEENIPTGGAILAANHLDAGDTIALPACVKPAMIFPAKKELFEGTTPFRKLVAWFLTKVGQVPIDRGAGKGGANALGEVGEKLEQGAVIGIFPEGSRSVDGRLYKGHTGVARMALDSGKPVVPVGLINTYLKKNRLGIPMMKNAKIVIGKPIDYSAYRPDARNAKVMRWVTNDIMAQIQQLTGQEYLDVYLVRVKRGELDRAELDRFALPSPNHEQEPPVV